MTDQLAKALPVNRIWWISEAGDDNNDGSGPNQCVTPDRIIELLENQPSVMVVYVHNGKETVLEARPLCKLD